MALIIGNIALIAQPLPQRDCGFSESPVSKDYILPGANCISASIWEGDDTYQPTNPALSTRTIKVNFIFWTLPTGSFSGAPNDVGNFRLQGANADPMHQAYIDGVAEEIKDRIADLTDPMNPVCYNGALDFIEDSKIQFDVQYYTIEDGFAWDIDNSGAGNDDFCPRSWSTAYNNYVFQKLNEAGVREGLNVFWPNEGNYYEQIVIEGLTNLVNNIEASDCSQFPSYSNYSLRQRITMTNEFLIYKFGTEYTTNFDFDQAVLSVARTLIHEIGHSFGLSHLFGADCPCIENIMYSGASCNNVYASIANYLSSEQMGEIHHSLHRSSMRKYVVCEAPPEISKDVPRVIAGAQIWDFNSHIHNNIVLEAGADLTICGEIYMPKDGYILVKRGAKLTVDGGTISFHRSELPDCTDERWGGIIVQGSGKFRPHSLVDINNLQVDDPGVVLLNEAHLSYANTAISTKKDDEDWWSQSYYGGIVIAENNTTFENCKRAVEFLKHKSQNMSRFTDCNFTCTDGEAFAGVTMWATQGISFDNCTFDKMGNTCIELYDATASITNGCSFSGTNNGIYITNTMPALTETVIGSPAPDASNFFTQCSHAINTHGASKLTVQYNTFNSNNYGLSMHGNSDIILSTENIYDNHNTAEQFENTFGGIVTSDCNDLNNNGFGIKIKGDNNQYTFFNNEFTNNAGIDVFLAALEDNNQNTTQGWIPNIGDPNTPAFNVFTDNNSPRDIYTPLGETVAFDYFIPNNNTNQRLIPECAANTNSPQNCSFLFNFNNQEAFATAPPGCITITEFHECETRTCLDELYTRLDSLKNLIDGGNTPAVLHAMQSDPAHAYQLMDAASPYLSDEVLLTLLSSSLSSNQKASLLIDNAPLTEPVMSSAQQHVSTATYNQLISIQNTVAFSPRRLLEAGIHHTGIAKDRALSHLVHLAVSADDLLLAEELLSEDNTPKSVRALVALALYEEDWTKAQSRINHLPLEEADFADIMSVNLTWQSAQGAYSLPTATAENLWQIAQSISPYSGYARGILTKLEGTYFYPQADILPQGFSAPLPPVAITSKKAGDIIVFPNPAKNHLSVQWLISNKEAVVDLYLYNATGRVVKKLQFPDVGTTQLDLAGLAAGVYWISLHQNGTSLQPQRIIIQ